MSVTAMLFLAALAAVADTPQSKPDQRIDPIVQLQMRALERDAEILRLKACSDAAIHYRDCIVDWQAGTVRKADPPKPEPAKPQVP